MGLAAPGINAPSMSTRKKTNKETSMNQKEKTIAILKELRKNAWEVEMKTLNEQDHNAHLWWVGYVHGLDDAIIKLSEAN